MTTEPTTDMLHVYYLDETGHIKARVLTALTVGPVLDPIIDKIPGSVRPTTPYELSMVFLPIANRTITGHYPGTSWVKTDCFDDKYGDDTTVCQLMTHLAADREYAQICYQKFIGVIQLHLTHAPKSVQ